MLPDKPGEEDRVLVARNLIFSLAILVPPIFNVNEAVAGPVTANPAFLEPLTTLQFTNEVNLAVLNKAVSFCPSILKYILPALFLNSKS